MSDYSSWFNYAWRGWSDCRGYTEDQKNAIMNSKAKCYNDLLKEATELKKQELVLKGGNPFYEPSTYYGQYRESYHHDSPDGAAGRYASQIFSSFSRYTAHKCTDVRVIPEERGEYELKLWRISHPQPLTEPQRQLWTVINELTATEPWAWPMMIGLNETFYTKPHLESYPVLVLVRDRFMGLGYTEEEFLSVQKELWNMLRWDNAKGM